MTGATPHRHDPEAAEYVLGTLSAAERREFETAMARDGELAAAVRAWEDRLVPLASRLPPVEPPARLWTEIERAVGGGEPADRAAEAESDDVLPWPVLAEVARLKRSRLLWRGATALAASVALTLAGLLAVQRGAAPDSGLVAVVNRSGELPALIVRVDPRAGTVQVREVAAERPPDRSLELWSIVGNDKPRSLGVLDRGATRIAIPAEDRPRLEGATLAVTVEPPGGSPTGSATGPVVYSGKLVPESP